MGKLQGFFLIAASMQSESCTPPGGQVTASVIVTSGAEYCRQRPGSPARSTAVSPVELSPVGLSLSVQFTFNTTLC